MTEKQHVARERTLTEPTFAELVQAMNVDDWASALSVVEDAVAIRPEEVNFRVVPADLLFHKMHDMRPCRLRMLVTEGARLRKPSPLRCQDAAAGGN
ncbi:hypothetical protein [Bradyrhizobium sp. Ec3.3]|uniref:hypothetical protein n=1 Tax=Bradyrhizobium sp. Ec3.3 TaxID=189753 RepID=UPI000418B752|nr:hypothetical protein [Bradyrhizobium sp. Ec3.3]